jgi:carbonic anhydrase
VHHNQCGTHFLAEEEFRQGFAELIDGDDAALAAEAVTDPEQTVRFDVELLRSAAVLPDTITVSGHVYDVTTGPVNTIVSAAPMHARTSSLKAG